MANALCDLKCAMDSTKSCGGKRYSNVYSTSEPIVGLDLVCSDSLVSTHGAVTFTPSFKAAGDDVSFEINYDDDGGKTPKNQTGMFTKEFHYPKVYHVSLIANDVNDTLVVSLIKFAFCIMSIVLTINFFDMYASPHKSIMAIPYLDMTEIHVGKILNGNQFLNSSS